MGNEKVFDLLVIGGGINGAGIALDAAGRGLSVILCEQHDLGSGTSSSSTKLIHGGLRYLEHYDFKLVHEALLEREILMRKAPHLISPKRFIIPYEPHQRPKWMIQLGLWLYDRLGKHSTLKPSQRINLYPDNPYAKPLKAPSSTAFAYSDCWVDDARLVIVNALAATQLGAVISPYTEVTLIEKEGKHWRVTTVNKLTREEIIHRAQALVNATGPWIKSFIEKEPLLKLQHRVRLVRGSHIVVPKRYEGDHCYMIQNSDHRVVFVIPYEKDYTLIGTTEEDCEQPSDKPQISETERCYLIDLFNTHFTKTIHHRDIVWEYAGIRPLVDREHSKSTDLSRDYHLEVQEVEGSPILSVYGGKITTYRTLAEKAVNKLSHYFPRASGPWTAEAPLPGADGLNFKFDTFLADQQQRYPWLPQSMLCRMAHQYGTRLNLILNGSHSLDDLGQHFGADCYEKELRYLIDYEWARSLDDLLFRRTKLALHLTPQERSKINDWLINILPIY